MEPIELEGQEKNLIRVGIIAIVIVVFLMVTVFTWNSWTQKRKGEVVMHSGVSYLGPTQAAAASTNSGKFTAPADTPTKIIKGQEYQYTITIPETLELVRLGENPYDIWAVKYANINPSSAVLIGVDNLQTNEKLKTYVNQPKIAYVENWWRQFGGLTGVSSITPFTNSKGLKGYKAKYTTGSGPSPNEDIFFEVPGKKNLVIHLSNGVLDQAVFDKIVDSVSWGAQSSPTPKP
jgi:hypothetical protein